ncbi:MAG: ATP-dependent metallopeptidase FtsH/Yme1/Tma family protein, partial [Thermoleophilaceae bacterium]|nr:ATP-dependent metallopeptidase FtsH/Yme1/Tma family protein [Thermoleophilaceae bacterium]
MKRRRAPVSGGQVASALFDPVRKSARWARRDKLSLFLLVASVVLTFLFFSLLGSIGPDSPGRQVPLSQLTSLVRGGDVTRATLLDQDARVVVDATNGEQLWAAYPQSDAQTANLVRTLSLSGTTVNVDQQSGKPARQILVQFLLPILLLVCLFALFTRAGQDGGAGAFAGFSKFTGKGRKKGKGAPGQTTFANVAGAGESVAELREIRDYLADPTKYERVGARAPKGV